MKNTGIRRKLDELGRITLPIELRRSLNLNTGNRPEIVLDGKFIVIKTGESRAMTRPIDELGRIVIPIEMRRALNFIENQPLDIYVEECDIYLGKVGCIICSSTDGLMEVDGALICKKHALMISDKVMEV